MPRFDYRVPIRDLSGGIIGVSKIARDILRVCRPGRRAKGGAIPARCELLSVIWMSDPDMLCTYFSPGLISPGGREAEMGVAGRKVSTMI
jgi:hypothetical protein